MFGLGDTYCTDDQLDMLALCPSEQGGVPDYTNCVCSGGTAAVTATASTVTSLSSYLPWILAAGVALYFIGGKR